MAALQQSPVALHSKLPPSPSAVTSPASRSVSLRPSSSFPALRLRSRLPTLRRLRRRGPTMMDTAAGSYAAALADVARSNGSLDATCTDMEKVGKLFSDPSILSFFTNPTVDLDRKRDTIDEFARSSDLQPHTANFLNIVVDMKRIDLIDDIVKEFEAAYNRITGTELAIVTSVVALESTHLAQIAKSVQRLTSAKNVRIRTAIDPTLIAGFTIRYGPSGSKFIDMSVKKQLDEITRQLELQVDLVGV